MTTSTTTSDKGNYGITPGEVLRTQIDYTTSISRKQWEGSIKKLSDELYDWSLDKMWKNRAKALGWTSICKINGKSLFDEYRNTKMDCKKKAPSDLKATKQYEYKEYTWCSKHGMWTVHKPEECKLTESKGENAKESKDGENRWILANTLEAMQSDDNSTVE